MSAASKPPARSGTASITRTPELQAAHARAPSMPGSYEPGIQGGEADPLTIGNQPALGDDVLDVTEVARLMRVGRNTVYELVGRNQIPHRRLGKQIRFSRAAIMRWLDP